MRKWLVPLRTALAVAAAVFLFVKAPDVAKMMRTPRTEPDTPSSPLALRVWIQDTFSGTATQWLVKQAGLFEKANKNVRVIVRRAQKDDWLAEQAVPPDLLLFERGAVSKPEDMLSSFHASYDLRPFLSHVGEKDGFLYAVPVCYSGYVLLSNAARPESVDLVMRSDREYQEFTAQNARSLVATPREARRLSALLDAGKGFPFEAEPYGTQTDLYLLAGLFPGGGERAKVAEAFLSHLLSGPAQDALPASGLLPVTSTARAPDEETQPLLHALYRQIESAARGFDP